MGIFSRLFQRGQDSGGDRPSEAGDTDVVERVDDAEAAAALAVGSEPAIATEAAAPSAPPPANLAPPPSAAPQASAAPPASAPAPTTAATAASPRAADLLAAT